MSGTTRQETRTPLSSRRRVAHFAVALALALLAISAFWAYRVRAAAEAAQFVPISTKRELVPAGMAISGVIRNGFARSAAAGDTVTAFVSIPVIWHDRVVIPPGA